MIGPCDQEVGIIYIFALKFFVNNRIGFQNGIVQFFQFGLRQSFIRLFKNRDEIPEIILVREANISFALVHQLFCIIQDIVTGRQILHSTRRHGFFLRTAAGNPKKCNTAYNCCKCVFKDAFQLFLFKYNNHNQVFLFYRRAIEMYFVNIVFQFSFAYAR